MWRPLLSLGIVALCFFGLTVSASPRGGNIVIRGAESGSHLQLTVSGSQLFVNGRLSGDRPVGCRLARGYRRASCRLEEASSIVIEMSSANDKVEVLDPLPVPLTAYLGAGSDKLIGNAEADTCYPQGSARNRCVGGGGDDICIAGPANTDCVGGAGNDYCKMSDGSDGCWGGPGRDECLMGAGSDGCHGEGGDDRLFGGPGSDQLYGGEGTDYCDGGPGVGRSHECEAGPGH
ncbi:MAG TPA: calcium-binding protein [Solirubrobacterales bacterium]